MFRIILSLVIASSFPLGLFAQDYDFDIKICHDPNSYPSISRNSYRIPVINGIRRTLRAIDPNCIIQFSEYACHNWESLPPFYSTEESLFAKEEALSRLAIVASLLAAEEVGLDPSLDYFRTLRWDDVHLFAHALLYNDLDRYSEIADEMDSYFYPGHEALQNIFEISAGILAHENDPSLQLDTIPLFANAILIYRGILDYSFAFIIGHELYHNNGNVCLTTDKSMAEITGSWRVLVDLQSENNLYEPRAPELNELLADRCALRIMEMVDRNIEGYVLNSNLMSKIRRSVADALSGPILLGYHDYYSESGELKINFVPDYLYPMTRLLLINSVPRNMEKKDSWAIKIDGNTGAQLFHIILERSKAYPGSSGEIPAEIFQELPPGVEKSYHSNVWNDQTYICKRKK